MSNQIRGDVHHTGRMDDQVVVRERADGARELRVNGVFVMDDAETSSERLLAHELTGEVLVGGLGLGFTTRELLRNPEVTRVVVAELHREVVDAVDLPDDARLEVVVGDVRDVIEGTDVVDAIVLDVDNGPDFLVHEQNAALYRADFVRVCAARADELRIWSMSDNTALREVLGRWFHDVVVTEVPVTLQSRREHYWILTGKHAVRSPARA